MPQTDTICCPICSKSFIKPRKEITRQNKKGNFTFYCDPHCAAIGANMKRDPELQKDMGKRLAQWCRDNPDKRPHKAVNSFRIILRKVRQRIKTLNRLQHKFDLDVEYLTRLWEDQSGKCALSGVTMPLPTYTSGASKLTQASLDRIDSDKGYIKGNVQFVCMGLNFAKNSKSQQEALDFVKAIREAATPPE